MKDSDSTNHHIPKIVVVAYQPLAKVSAEELKNKLSTTPTDIKKKKIRPMPHNVQHVVG